MALIFKQLKIAFKTNNKSFIIFFSLEIHNCNILYGNS